MSNNYQEKYLQLEEEVLQMKKYLTFNDEQINVHSAAMGDLILLISAQIESIAKEMYKDVTGDDSRKKFDYDCIEYFIKEWSLDKKIVELNHPSIHISNKIYKPFKKNESKTGSGSPIFGWNNAYQNIKHDKVNSLSWQSVKYILESLSALYLLNIYYNFQPKLNLNLTDSNEINCRFDSKIFIVRKYSFGVNIKDRYPKNNEYYESSLIIVPEEDSFNKFLEVNEQNLQRKGQLMFDKIAEQLGYKHLNIKSVNNQLVIDKVPLNFDASKFGAEFTKAFKELQATSSLEYEIKALQENQVATAGAFMNIKYNVEINRNQY